MADAETRAKLRVLLSALLARRGGAGLLYVPRGEEGQRRMIRSLLDADGGDVNDETRSLIDWFREMDGEGHATP